MSARLKRAVAVLGLSALGVALIAAPSIGGAPQSRQTAKLLFDQRKPSKPAGTTLDIDYRDPANPNGKPPSVRRVVLKVARGARFDTSVPALCQATNEELMAQGEGACPEQSKVGVGEVRVDTGLPGTGRFVEAEIDFFNNTDELIYLTTVRDSGAHTVIRAEVKGRLIVTDVEMLPGTPPDGASIDMVHTRDPRFATGRGENRRAYLTTPHRCPRSGRWVNSVILTYADGVTQRVRTSSPCRMPA